MTKIEYYSKDSKKNRLVQKTEIRGVRKLELQEKLIESLRGIDLGFTARLAEVQHTWHLPEVDVTGKFYYLTFKNGASSIDEFVEFIHSKIIPFCVPEKVRRQLERKFAETGDYGYIQKLSDRARNLFVQKDPELTTGEPGELILFILMEVVLQAPIIACKMYLKTNQNVPVHGSDGIHVSFDPHTDTLNLYWGESKLFQNLSTAVDKVCESIESFTKNSGTRNPRDRDLEVIQDHIAVDNDEMKEQILKYFDPYEPQSNNLQENFACFVGFDYNLLEDGKLERATIVKDFEKRYLERVKSACELFRNKIVARDIAHLKFVFFLIPFKSVRELRQKFYGKLGVNYDPGTGE